MIDFAVYPQDTSIYTITDETRIGEIVDEINAMAKTEITEGYPYPDRMSDQYYDLRLSNNGEMFSIELDESRIYINAQRHETFSADCSDLCSLLEQTYYDRMSGTIE